MKKIINLLLLLNCILLLGACIDDKGNYTYQDKDEVLPIQISGLENAITIPQGNVLKLSPVVENDDPSRYTYSWFVMESQTAGSLPKRVDIADTKNLEYTVSLSPATWLLNFEVFDEKRDIFRRKEIKLTVSASPVDLGWYVLKDENGETDFDYINPDGEVYRDLLYLAGYEQRKDRTASEFRREEDGAFLYRARVLPGCKEEYGDGGDGIDPIADGPPGAFAIRL